MGDCCALDTPQITSRCSSPPDPGALNPRHFAIHASVAAVANHTPEADVAHPGVDHLRPASRGAVAHAIAVRAEVGAALDRRVT